MSKDNYSTTTQYQPAARENTGCAYAHVAGFFAHDSEIPASQVAPHQSGLSGIEPAFGGVIGETTQLVNLLEHYIFVMPELALHLVRLSDAIACVRTRLGPELELLAQYTDDTTSAKATAVVVAAEATDIEDIAAKIRAYIIYDGYFSVQRVPALTISQFAAQVALTCHRVLEDLPFTSIDIEEITAIVQAVKMMFELLEQRFRPHEASSRLLVQSEAATDVLRPAQLAQVWRLSATDLHERTCRVAFYRWKAGHHFFGMCAIFCREYLLRANVAFECGEEAEVAEALRNATAFLRATTAAMWYAANYPREVYQNVIRPSMESTEAPHGFSGTDHSDYNRMKVSKARLQQALIGCYGRNLQYWPSEIAEAFIPFHETDISDVEHHVSIAIAKVGSDSSLAQKKWQADLPNDMPHLNAAALLRAIGDERRREFED